MKQNKKIFAIPHEIENRSGIGTNRLIKEGVAKLVTNTVDIINDLEKIKEYREKKIKEKIIQKNSTNKIQKNNTSTSKINKITESKTEIKEIKKKHKKIKLLKSKQNKRYKKENLTIKSIKNKEQKEIYKIILEKESNIDEIYKKTSKDIGKINEILLILEIEGYIRKTAGGYKCT